MTKSFKETPTYETQRAYQKNAPYSQAQKKRHSQRKSTGENAQKERP
jgi:hypothetical protein